MFNLLEENFVNNILLSIIIFFHELQIVSVQNFVFNFQLIDISEHVLDENEYCGIIKKCTLEQD